jgi:hypothetical protein
LRAWEIAADRPLHEEFSQKYREARRPPLWRLRNSGENDDTDTE